MLNLITNIKRQLSRNAFNITNEDVNKLIKDINVYISTIKEMKGKIDELNEKVNELSIVKEPINSKNINKQ